MSNTTQNQTDGYVISKNGHKATIQFGCKEIPNEMFKENDEIVSVTLPNSVKTVGDFAFCGCMALRELKLPDSIIGLGFDAISFCPLLEELHIPENVTLIGGSFAGCTSLKNISVDSNNPVYCNKGNCLIDTDEKTLMWGCSNSTIPNDGSVTKIGREAFYRCTFQEIHIPASVETIEENAFSQCTSLSALYIHKTMQFIEDEAFAGCSSLVINYEGTQEQWEQVYAGNDVKVVPNARVQSPQKIQAQKDQEQTKKKSGCYVATCVYGSYDCPQVWTLRRFRDDTLGATWYGRAFIRTYYAISPTLVKWFGKTTWFKRMWQGTLDKMVAKLNRNGVADTPYQDKDWR